MLSNLIVTIVVVPLVLGVVAAVVANLSTTGRQPLIALLIPLFAAIILISLDGLPAFPPVRAIHKLPYILAMAGILFALLALWKKPAPAIAAVLAAVVAVALPAWWMGRNVLANNSQKAIVVAALLAVAVIGTLIAARRKRPVSGEAHVWPQAIFATSLAGALVAILGGYMGMAMFNGGLAALAGGYLLVAYTGWWRGKTGAFALEGVALAAFAWVAFTGILVTALLAPVASTAALVLTASTLALAPFSNFYSPCAERVPHALRPVALGLIAAIPAIAGILIAALQFQA